MKSNHHHPRALYQYCAVYINLAHRSRASTWSMLKRHQHRGDIIMNKPENVTGKVQLIKPPAPRGDARGRAKNCAAIGL